MIDFTPGNIDKPALQEAISIANRLFCGYQITVNDQPIPASSATVRRGVKYVSLDEESRNIWDDPDMLPAHKYQNIPQVDISTYIRDYSTDCGAQVGPIRLGPSSIIVDYQYSASGERHTVDMDIDSDTAQRFLKMTHINKLAELITAGDDVQFESNLSMLVFREDSVTDMLLNGNPAYDVEIGKLYGAFVTRPNVEIYVPYRQGWSKMLNIAPFHKGTDHTEFTVIDDGSKMVNLIDASAISIWDGVSTKIESHGIEVEDMKTKTLDSLDAFEHKMRRLIGTHEQMRDIIINPEESTVKKFYVVYTIKGINVNGFEFDMP